MTIVSSLFFAAEIVIAGYFVKSENPAVMSTVQFGVMGGLSFVAALLIGDFAFLSIGNNIFPEGWYGNTFPYRNYRFCALNSLRLR